MKNNRKQSTVFKALIVLMTLFSLNNYAQTPNSVGIGTTNPNNSALLHLESSNQGFLMTRLTTSQINAITTPTVGLIVYNTSDQCYWYKRPTYWARLCNTDSINAQSVVTNYLNADTAIINNLNFGNGYGDSIFVHYLQADTAFIHQLTVNNIVSNTIKTDSLYIGGIPIQTIVTNSITSLAWLLNGNSGTNPATNFLGTKDNQDLVLRTNNTEKLRVLKTGEVGIGTITPTYSLDVIGSFGFGEDKRRIEFLNDAGNINTQSGFYQTDYLSPGTIINYPEALTSPAPEQYGLINIRHATTFPSFVFQTQIASAVNNDKMWFRKVVNNPAAPWHEFITSVNLANSVSLLAPATFNLNAWTLIGNSLTNPATNFLGTIDNQPMIIKTNGMQRFSFTKTGELLSYTFGTSTNPMFSFGNNGANIGSGIYYNNGLNAVAFSALNKELATIGDNFIFTPRNLSNPLNTISGTFDCFIYGNSNTITTTGYQNVIMGVSNTLKNTIIGNSYTNNIIGVQNTLIGGGNYQVENCILGSRNNANGSVTTSFIIGNGNTLNNGANLTTLLGVSLNSSHVSATVIGNNTSSFANNCVVVGASGGARVYSNAISTTGVALAPGGGAWASVSDRNLKENITIIDTKNILDKLVSVPVTEWTYISQPADTMNKYAPQGVHYDKAPVHIGPMAQDFSAVFGYGEFKDKITTSDIDGVVFASVQALAIENKDLKSKLEATLKEFEELKKIVNEIKNR